MNENNLDNNNSYDNSLGNNSRKTTPYRASSNLNTAIENPQINLNSATGVNMKDLGYSNYASDDSRDAGFLNNDINEDSDFSSNSNLTVADFSEDDNSHTRSNNNYSYAPVMKEKKRKGDNPISNLIHSKEFKTGIVIIFILVLFLMVMPYIYDFFRNLGMQFTA